MRISKFWLKDKFIIFFGHCVSQLSKAVQEEPSGGAGQRNTNEAYYSTATMPFYWIFVQKLFETNLNFKYPRVKILKKIYVPTKYSTLKIDITSKVPLLFRISYFLLPKIEINIAGVFYNIKNGSSFITSKSLSENLSNHNKPLYFCCLLEKTRI